MNEYLQISHALRTFSNHERQSLLAMNDDSGGGTPEQQIILRADSGLLGQSWKEVEDLGDARITELKRKYGQAQLEFQRGPIAQSEFETRILQFFTEAAQIEYQPVLFEGLYQAYLAGQIALEQENPGRVEKFKPVAIANTRRILTAAEVEAKRALVEAIKNSTALPLDEALAVKVTGRQTVHRRVKYAKECMDGVYG